MKSRYKQNIIAIHHFVFVFTFEFPVRIVDQNQDARTTTSPSAGKLSQGHLIDLHRPIQHEKLLPGIAHHMITQVSDQGRDGAW